MTIERDHPLLNYSSEGRKFRQEISSLARRALRAGLTSDEFIRVVQSEAYLLHGWNFTMFGVLQSEVEANREQAIP